MRGKGVRPTHCLHTTQAMWDVNLQALFNVCLSQEKKKGLEKEMYPVTHCRPFLRFSFRVSEIRLEMLNSAFFETVLTFDEVAVTYCWVKPQILMVLEGSLELS